MYTSKFKTRYVYVRSQPFCTMLDTYLSINSRVDCYHTTFANNHVWPSDLCTYVCDTDTMHTYRVLQIVTKDDCCLCYGLRIVTNQPFVTINHFRHSYIRAYWWRQCVRMWMECMKGRSSAVLSISVIVVYSKLGQVLLSL